ncbi:hypothetical protein [uncultured Erythrobacter sp.]|uniref:hypothetical protein n=1 Tax=uncultured Erythrobacter sp. TaxID=263913 RepID=UPI0026066C16|nr:hypothetical protein [uncultured Erythrobacter sp.]
MDKRENQHNSEDMGSAHVNAPMSAMRAAFGLSALAGDQVSLIHKIARAQENMILLSAGAQTIAGVMERGSALARNIQEVRKAAQERSKRSFDTQMLLGMLDQRIADLADRIEIAENGFVEKYGDAWAEELALDILDPDEIPERNSGESIEEYRERLKPMLIGKLLDENGEIKPEYKDHPKYGEFAEWAKDQHEMRPLLEEKAKIDAIQNDPSRSDAEIEADTREILQGLNVQELQAAREVGEMNEPAQQVARAEFDNRIDDMGVGGDFSMENSAF